MVKIDYLLRTFPKNLVTYISLEEYVVPRVCPVKKIHMSLKAKEKVNEMNEENILIPLTESTDWVHPIVIAKTKDSLYGPS